LTGLSGSHLEAGGIKIVVRRFANSGMRQIPFTRFFADSFTSVCPQPGDQPRDHC
jgi:hypothetical protein